VLVHGTKADAQALREETARVLATLGLRLSPAKTRIVHMSEAFDFLGFRIQWKRKRGSAEWHVYTFIADRPVRSLKARIRALTYRTSQQNPSSVLIRLNQIMRGWVNYFRHAVCKHTLGKLANFAWWRVIRWLRTLHRWRWKDVRKAFTTPHGRWTPITAGGVELFSMATVPVVRLQQQPHDLGRSPLRGLIPSICHARKKWLLVNMNGTAAATRLAASPGRSSPWPTTERFCSLTIAWPRFPNCVTSSRSSSVISPHRVNWMAGRSGRR
jgi:hypothetical protein